MALNTLDSRRPAEKRKDTFRRPLSVLEFAGLAAEHRVLDVGTGFGYWAEFVASISERRVDCHNASEWKSFFDHVGFDKSTARLRKLEQKYRFFWSSFNDPANGASKAYDLVICYGIYHDLYDMKVDRQRFLRSIKDALVEGTGRFLLVDHRAAKGRGAQDAGSNRGLHRIEDVVVRREVEKAGFEVDKESQMLRYAQDNLRSGAWTSKSEVELRT